VSERTPDVAAMPVKRTEIEVMFLRTGDEPAETRRGWERLGAVESGTLPGGRYLRARLRGEPPEVYERIRPRSRRW
jgi:hypothetical protein